MTLGPKHRTRSWFMLGGLVMAGLILIGTAVYLGTGEPDPLRGAQGTLAPGAGASDPGTLLTGTSKPR